MLSSDIYRIQSSISDLRQELSYIQKTHAATLKYMELLEKKLDQLLVQTRPPEAQTILLASQVVAWQPQYEALLRSMVKIDKREELDDGF